MLDTSVYQPAMVHELIPQANRRRVLLGSGALGATLAGCLGDDDDVDDGDDVDDTDDVDDMDDVDDTDGVDDTDDTDDADDDAVDMVEIHDIVLLYTDSVHLTEPAADYGYNPSGGDAPFPWRFHDTQARYFYFSQPNAQFYPLLVDDYNYEPGILEVTLHDDFYWWSGDQMTIDDLILEREWANWTHGGDELDAHETIVTWEKIDDFTARFALVDTWNETFAIDQWLEATGQYPNHSRAYFQRWIDQYEDVGGDLDAIEDIREDIWDEEHTEDEQIVHNFYHPFEFRLDGSIGDVQEMHYDLEFVPEKNGNLRHFANPQHSEFVPNFEIIRAHIVEEHDVWEREQFSNQEIAHISYDPDIGDGLDFPTVTHESPATGRSPMGFNFNHDVHPSDNVHFRRAFAYLTPNTAWDRFDRWPNTQYHPFYEHQLDGFVSEDIVDALTDYHYDEMRHDDAEDELVAGGFERNADGRWLLSEDSVWGEAGEPMEFTNNHLLGADAAMDPYDEATDFWGDLDDFGIQTEHIYSLEDAWGVHEDYVFTTQYTGGSLRLAVPDTVFHNIFVQPDPTRNAYNVGATISAPELLETTGPAPSTDDWVEFDIEAMAARLAVTTEEEAYQSLVDQLTWVTNQTVNHWCVFTELSMTIANDYRWNVSHIDDRPEEPGRGGEFRGGIQYVPEDER